MKNKMTFLWRTAVLSLFFLLLFGSRGMKADAASGAVITHVHKGDSRNGGGCYGERVVTVWDCNSYNIDIGFNGTDYIYNCRNCGTTWSSQGKAEGSRCNGRGTTVSYEPNCGKSGAAAVTFSCAKSTENWVQELDLVASYAVHESDIRVTGYLWNGKAGADTYHVTSNGTYTLQLSGSGNVNFSPQVSVTVDNIDRTAPVIDFFGPETEDWSGSVQLTVSASDAQAGLAGQAYSFDNGASWVAENTYTVTENGTYCVCVRDAAGNVSEAGTTVGNIDTTAPQISVSMSPAAEQWYDGSLTVTVHAEDAESGLADQPYSFDGGATYIVGNQYTFFESGTVEIVVADRAGNLGRLSVGVDKKVRPAQPQGSPESGGTGAGSGQAGSSGGAGTGGAGAGSAEAGTNGTGGASGAGAGSAEAGTNGAGGASGAGTEAGTSGAGGASGAGTEAGTSGAVGASGAGAGSAEAGTNGTGGASGAGAGGRGRNSGDTGSGDDARTGSGSSGTGAEGRSQGDSRKLTLPRGAKPDGRGGETMRQHYPDAEWREIFPAESEDGAGRCTDGPGNGESGVSEEETLIQNELLSSEHDREASLLEREQDDGGSAGKNMPEEKRGLYYVILAAFGVIVTAALLCGWMLLFGVRVYTRDASGRYRIAGVTRVASKEGGKQKTVPLTRRIIRNSETNDLRLRFGSLCLSRYGGEIMLLTYKTMSREFAVGRTVLLRMRA